MESGKLSGERAMSPALAPAYSSVTEHPGQPASRIQLDMLGARYAWAADHARGKDVLEIACGAGMGLAALAEVARSVHAGDVDPDNLRQARAACAGQSNIALREFPAEDLPFIEESFDVVLLFEAIYYLLDVRQFLREAYRVLRPAGTLLIVTVNPDWTGFNPSPFKTRYWSAAELRTLLRDGGFSARVQGAFPETSGWQEWAISRIRRAAVALNLVPRTMHGKALLKRIFCGPLQEVPERVSTASLRPRLEEPEPARSRQHRVLYATARKENV
jgi:ubiquinone/menaquinone biosynthesis C-methylase UbiE